MKKLIIILAVIIYSVNLQAQTRFYLTQLTPAITSITPNANWTVTSTYSTFFLNTYRDRVASVSYQSGASGAASPQKMINIQYVSAPLIAQTINGTLTGQIRFGRSTGTVTILGIVYLRKISSSGTITDIGNTTTTAINVGTPANRSISLSLSSVSISAGDRLVIEVGGSYTTGTVTTLTMNTPIITNATSDLPVDNTTVSGLNPWFEFSQTLQFQSQLNTF